MCVWVVARLPQRLKSTFFEIFRVEGSRRRPGVKKKLSKTLLLVLEVIVQPPKHTFEIGFFSCFSALGYVKICRFFASLFNFVFSHTSSIVYRCEIFSRPYSSVLQFYTGWGTQVTFLIGVGCEIFKFPCIMLEYILEVVKFLKAQKQRKTVHLGSLQVMYLL